MPDVVRIAMWSGPRSLSTPMMRAFENREDTRVIDEPFYACYLLDTAIDHPMRDKIIASQPTDWREVVAQLCGPVERPVFFQKHMAHHLLPSMGRDWLDEVESCFLIRSPAEILASYTQKRDEVTLADIGIAQMVELFDRAADRTGRAPPVLLTDDLQRDPRAALTALCARIGIPFSERMLRWPPGRRATDGVWASHWYENVERSTGFEPHRPREVVLTEALQRVADAAEPHHRRLLEARLMG